MKTEREKTFQKLNNHYEPYSFPFIFLIFQHTYTRLEYQTNQNIWMVQQGNWICQKIIPEFNGIKKNHNFFHENYIIIIVVNNLTKKNYYDATTHTQGQRQKKWQLPKKYYFRYTVQDINKYVEYDSEISLLWNVMCVCVCNIIKKIIVFFYKKKIK